MYGEIPANARKVYQYTKEWNFVNEWNSIMEASRFYTGGTAQIYLVFVMVNVTLHQAIGGHMKNIIKKKQKN